MKQQRKMFDINPVIRITQLSSQVGSNKNKVQQIYFVHVYDLQRLT